MSVIPLNVSTSSIPDLHCPIFGAGDKPLRLTVESDSGDVRCVAVEREDGIGICTLNVVELDGMMASGGKIAFIGGYTQAVYLGVGVGDCTGADAAEGFPEALGMRLVNGKCQGCVGFRTESCGHSPLYIVSRKQACMWDISNAHLCTE